MAYTTIWKYTLDIRDHQEVSLPKGSQILTVGVQQGLLCLWALVDQHQFLESRSIYIVGTGHPAPPDDATLLGRVEFSGALIFHVFAR